MAAIVNPLTVQRGFPVQEQPLTPPGYVNAVLLAANVAENVAVPAGAAYARLTTTGDLYCAYLASTSSLVTNGTFAADASWTKGTGWAIAAGKATLDGAHATAISQTITTLETGRSYRVVYTVSGRTAGTITASVGSTAGTARSADGTYTETIICGATTTLAFTGSATFDGSIDDVSVTPIAIVPGDNTTGTAAELIKAAVGSEWRYVNGLAALSLVSAGTPIVTVSFFAS